MFYLAPHLLRRRLRSTFYAASRLILLVPDFFSKFVRFTLLVLFFVRPHTGTLLMAAGGFPRLGFNLKRLHSTPAIISKRTLLGISRPQYRPAMVTFANPIFFPLNSPKATNSNSVMADRRWLPVWIVRPSTVTT